MAERSNYTKVSTKLDIVIGPDGRILHHSVISPNFRQFDKKSLIKPIQIFRRRIDDSCLEDLFKSGGEVTIWLASNRNEVLAMQTGEC